MELTTEKDSNYHNLHELSLSDILQGINDEDQTVPLAVKKSMKQIEALSATVISKMKAGGRLFYIGAGTSGRLGVLDASECPPTFGVPADMVIGLIAGGDTAIRKAVENAEDDEKQAWKDLEVYGINNKDVVVGIAASGTTPYVLGGLQVANAKGIVTGCVVCNADCPISREARFPVEVVVGPEFLTGSTRMKAGTAQKLVLNMLTTSVMIGLGKVRGNKMIDMQLNNSKLYKRGVDIVMKETGADEETAKRLLKKHGSIREAIEEASRR
jgi:N-acetylmuramic acid 6-phosphate etherase